MTESPPRKKPYSRPTGKRRGLLIINTGDGKGKTTAALGLAARAHGRGKSVRFFQAGWLRAAEAISGGEHFLVVLDELTYPSIYGWLPVSEVVTALRQRPTQVHVLITGRRCPPELIEIADTVTEMMAVKHAFKAGIPAQRGIEH
jgi:cob(I)alamin adenosyltransferase